jgi:hypothetical protein
MVKMITNIGEHKIIDFDDHTLYLAYDVVDELWGDKVIGKNAVLTGAFLYTFNTCRYKEISKKLPVYKVIESDFCDMMKPKSIAQIRLEQSWVRNGVDF